MKPLVFFLLLILAALQYRLWFDTGGYPEMVSLREQVAAQNGGNEKLAEENAILETRIVGLKHDHYQVEGEARADFDLIRPDETFFRFLTP
jgi:cell division protein FtsB